LIKPGLAWASLKMGTGYYTNLCGSGTAATTYSCFNGCSVDTGTCTATNNGAVRYQCLGNWNQCLENESSWSNGVSLGDPGCGNTVQLAVYDRKCRREDGTWDGLCRLLGYMVWYSGDCRPGVAGYATGIPQAPTVTALPTTTSKFSTPVPTSRVIATPTLAKTQIACGKACNTDNDCSSGLFCENRLCRNRDCPLDKSCFCSPVTGGALDEENQATESPKTGGQVWILGVGLLVMGFAGFKLAKLGRILWS